MPAIDLSVLCIPAECDNIKSPIEYEIASRWDAYLLCDICRHFASVMLHFASLISHNLRCIPAYTHQIPNGISSHLLRDNMYIISKIIADLETHKIGSLNLRLYCLSASAYLVSVLPLTLKMRASPCPGSG